MYGRATYRVGFIAVALWQRRADIRSLYRHPLRRNGLSGGLRSGRWDQIEQSHDSPGVSLTFGCVAASCRKPITRLRSQSRRDQLCKGLQGRLVEHGDTACE